MTPDRHLDWDGCVNVRDLGGLRTVDGRELRRGAVVRADAVDRLSAAGWSALWEHGIRTVIDLRNDDERSPDVAPRPEGLTTVHLPLDGIEDSEFWGYWASGPQFGTPLYYRPFLDRFPHRTAAVIAAIAHAPPGGVLVHCGVGRDRTGLISLLLLALAGVAPEDIAADYELSAGRVGVHDRFAEIEEYLRARNTTGADLVAAMATELDAEDYLRSAGVTGDDIAAVRDRLLNPPRS